MSYSICLQRDGEAVQVPSHEEGGAYVLGGTTEAALNITYNYSWFYRRCIDSGGIRWLYGLTGKETEAVLEAAVNELGTRQYKDYWAPTPGNAGHALSILLKWARLYPDAIWTGD